MVRRPARHGTAFLPRPLAGSRRATGRGERGRLPPPAPVGRSCVGNAGRFHAADGLPRHRLEELPRRSARPVGRRAQAARHLRSGGVVEGVGDHGFDGVEGRARPLPSWALHLCACRSNPGIRRRDPRYAEGLGRLLRPHHAHRDDRRARRGPLHLGDGARQRRGRGDEGRAASSRPPVVRSFPYASNASRSSRVSPAIDPPPSPKNPAASSRFSF